MQEARKTTQQDTAGQPFFAWWQTLYEEAWKPVLNAPQLGLTRYYQEHVNQSMDKYCQLQLTAAEFIRMLCQPVEKSLWEAQDMLLTSGVNGAKPGDAKAFYSRWISSLEKRFMEMYRSPDYVQCLQKALGSFNEFMASRQKVLEDVLKTMPVPTNSDMDELYKELYDLKKRVRDLEKKQRQK